MKNIWMLIILLIGVGGISKAQDRTKDDTAIKQTIGRFGNSWAKADFSDMGDYMTPDCHWINVVGMHWHTLKEVQFAHQAFASRMLKGVEAKDLETTIKFVTNEVAIAYVLSHVGAFYPPDGVNRGGNKQGDKDNMATFVLVKQRGKWLITSAQNNDVISQAAAANPVLHMDK